jgi:hypothetical protein
MRPVGHPFGECHRSLYFCAVQAHLCAPDSLCGCLTSDAVAMFCSARTGPVGQPPVRAGMVPVQLDFLVLYSAEKLIKEHVGHPAPIAVHADGYSQCLQPACPFLTRKLAALICFKAVPQSAPLEATESDSALNDSVVSMMSEILQLRSLRECHSIKAHR